MELINLDIYDIYLDTSPDTSPEPEDVTYTDYGENEPATDNATISTEFAEYEEAFTTKPELPKITPRFREFVTPPANHEAEDLLRTAWGSPPSKFDRWIHRLGATTAFVVAATLSFVVTAALFGAVRGVLAFMDNRDVHLHVHSPAAPPPTPCVNSRRQDERRVTFGPPSNMVAGASALMPATSHESFSSSNATELTDMPQYEEVTRCDNTPPPPDYPPPPLPTPEYSSAVHGFISGLQASLARGQKAV